MRKGAESYVTKYSNPHQDFIKKAMGNGQPANVIVVLDTHSDTFSGQLQATGGLTGVKTSLTLPDLLRTYVRDVLLQEMAKASVQARSYNTIPEIRPGVLPWADITPKVCGGWRIMVMVSCGSSVTQPIHWDYITQLFSR